MPRPLPREFIALMAFVTSLVALSTDAMLPALAQMGQDLRVADANDPQLIVTTLFLGLALAQIVYGPLSDSLGRKRVLIAGLAIFCGGCLISLLARSFPVMLAGRLLQGIGTAGPEIVAIAMIRDVYAGARMARIMSLITSVFILVPVVAPSLGQVVLVAAGWRAIFLVLLSGACLVGLWIALRQPETLAPENRIRFALRPILNGIGETLRHPVARSYMIANGLVSGAFIGYLASAQQILELQYGLGPRFPLYFALLALSIGAASLVNARLVVALGMRRLTLAALTSIVAISALFAIYALACRGTPPFGLFLPYMLVVFFFFGILFGNFSALAMEPMGHIAGIAAAVTGSFTTLLSMAMGTVIARAYDGTVLPLVGGFGLLGLASLAVARRAEAGRRRRATA
jgi:DHA1 family bicyclomycin/chloramphenicol resistance-like MFS transporter